MSTDFNNPGREPARVQDILARAWHDLSDHAKDGTPFGAPACHCTNFALRLERILDWYTTGPEEPTGLGAAVTNPVSGQVFVRAAHTALPWRGQADPAEQWTDPTGEDWWTWGNLPRPLLIQTTGWLPPAETPDSSAAGEPSGLAAVVVDANGEAWVRCGSSRNPWQQAHPHAGKATIVAAWTDLNHPVTIHSHGVNLVPHNETRHDVG